MRRTIKTAVYIIFDLTCVLICLITAFTLKYDNPAVWFGLPNNFEVYAAFACSSVLCNLVFGCYNFISKYTGLTEGLKLVCACFVNTLLATAAAWALSVPSPLPVALITGMTELVLMCAFRFSFRIASQLRMSLKSNFWGNRCNRIIIFDNVDEAKAIIEKLRNEDKGLRYTALVNRSPLAETGARLNGIRIPGGGIECLERSVAKFMPEEVIFTRNVLKAMPVEKIIRSCPAQNCRFKLYSGIEDYPASANFCDISIESLLGRAQAGLDEEQIRGLLRGKTVLVTGGAGSIGSEICSQALRLGCKKLIVFDICENSLFELDNELKQAYPHDRYSLAVGSVRDEQRLDEVFAAYRPEIVFHAAAHKHVPLMELNPGEAIKNNIIGTLNTAKKAAEFKVERFILISTDKAVNPANVMGATKRAAEMLMQSLNLKTKGTVFAAVRFGNVLGSSGSVVPVFKKQISSGGPVTVTHPEMTRYFMTIPEAAHLVMQAGAVARGGEIFLLDMGEPVRIADLAGTMIKLSGLVPERDIKIEFTGPRPGEKLNEELKQNDERICATGYDKISVCLPSAIEEDFDVRLAALVQAITDSGKTNYRAAILELVKEYNF